MGDIPAWLGLSIVLGLGLDAVFQTERVHSAFERLVQRWAGGWEFAYRQGFPNSPTLGGRVWVLSLALGAFALTWALQSVTFVFAGRDFQWLVRLLVDLGLFYALFSVRRRATLAVAVQQWLEGGRPDKAAKLLARFGPRLETDDAEAIAAATVRRLGGSTLELGANVAFWGLVGGPPLAAAALVVRVAVDHANQQNPDGGGEFFESPRRLENLLLQPATWFAGLGTRVALGFVGVRGADAVETFLAHGDEPPSQRLASMMVTGLDLGPAAGGRAGGSIVSSSDIGRAVMVLWGSSLTAALVASGLRALLLAFV
jgi:hypothetical protein